MKRIILALVTLFLAVLTFQTANAQDPSAIAKGAGLWANNCTRCHNARSPMERNDRSWVTVVNHMRARANLTRSEARAIAAYLQAINTPETNTTAGKRDDRNNNAKTGSSKASASNEPVQGKTIVEQPDGRRPPVIESGGTRSFLRSHTTHLQSR